MYVGETKEVCIAKLNPTIKAGFSRTGELDNTGVKDHSTKAWEKIQATIKK